MSTKPSVKCIPGQTDGNLLQNSVEIIPGRFYFLTMKANTRPKFTQWSHYFTIDEDLQYDPFYEDFGPLNLAQLYKYCKKVEDKLKSVVLETKKIVHYTVAEPKTKVNAAYLAGAYAILYLNMDPLDVYDKLTQGCAYSDFRDASVGYAVYTISLRDCLQAVAKAKLCRFFNLNDFSASEYLHYETVENGDLNWVVPEKFLAFAGPQSVGYKPPSKWRPTPMFSHTPESYVNYFKALNVTTVVRLNNRCYDAVKFTEAGIDHHDLIFVDGGTPPDELLQRFLKISEEAKGAIAVHCKAGLGRTGSMIACYIMKWYHFTAREAIAWLRICRPASIIGQQQHWLESKQYEMWMAGTNLQRPYHRFGVYSFSHGSSANDRLVNMTGETSSNESLSGLASQVTTLHINNTDINKNLPAEQPDEISQGDHLQQIKMDRAPASKNSSKALRCSWPLTFNSPAVKRGGSGSWPSATAAGRRNASLGKVAPAKRMTARKKTGSVLGTKTAPEDNRAVPSMLATSGADSPVAPLRRSQRILEPRVCKSVVSR